MHTIRKHLLVAGLAAVTAVPVIVTAAPQAHAAGRNGVCDPGEFCYYFNSNQGGSISDFTTSVADYGATQPTCYDFKSAGAGKGVCVKNNAASVWNRTTQVVHVYSNSNYGGYRQDVAPGAKVNLNNDPKNDLKNNDASHVIGALPTGQAPRNDYDGHPRGFAQNNCTAFAAWRVASRLGIPNFSNSWKTTWGNAGTWDDAARRVGIRVDKTPTVGSIAVNDVHKVGHVAYVNKVYPDGSFDVEEYNWNIPLHYGTRSHLHVSQAQADFQWMLHFKG